MRIKRKKAHRVKAASLPHQKHRNNIAVMCYLLTYVNKRALLKIFKIHFAVKRPQNVTHGAQRNVNVLRAKRVPRLANFFTRYIIASRWNLQIKKLLFNFAKILLMGENSEYALLSYAGQIASTALNAAFQASTSRSDRKWQEKMYQRQLEDNRENWRMLNEYNSPSAQMERLAAAGLNPHLVYGSGAVATSPTMPNSSQTSPNYRTPVKMDLDLLGPYIALRKLDNETALTNQQVNESKARESNLNAETNLKQWQYGFNKLVEDDLARNKRFEYLLKQEEYYITRDYGHQRAQEEIKRLQEETKRITEEIALTIARQGLTAAQTKDVLKSVEVKEATIEEIMTRCDVNYEVAEKVYQDGIHSALTNEKTVLDMYTTGSAAYQAAVGAMVLGGDLPGWTAPITRASRIVRGDNWHERRPYSTSRPTRKRKR